MEFFESFPTVPDNLDSRGHRFPDLADIRRTSAQECFAICEVLVDNLARCTLFPFSTCRRSRSSSPADALYEGGSIPGPRVYYNLDRNIFIVIFEHPDGRVCATDVMPDPQECH